MPVGVLAVRVGAGVVAVVPVVRGVGDVLAAAAAVRRGIRLESKRHVSHDRSPMQS